MGFGYDVGTAGRNFPGSLADGAQWNTNLSAAEITALSKGARPYTIRPANLLGWWPLDGLQSPEEELSGAKNNGTLTGTTAAFGPPYMQFTPRWPMGAILPTPTPAVVYFDVAGFADAAW
jgi:hypothetical protein